HGFKMLRTYLGRAAGDEGASLEVKPQGALGGAGQTDAARDYDRFSCREETLMMWIAGDEDWRLRIADIQAIEMQIDIQRGAQLAWAAGQLMLALDNPMGAHEVLPERRLYRPHQHRLGAAARVANRVEAEMKAVDQVNISAAGRS